MQLKVNDDGAAVLDEGKPVYVAEDGKEIPVDVPSLFSKITALNNESRDHRLKAKEALGKVQAFDGMDPDEVTKALATVRNLSDKKLVEAGEVETMKAEMAKGYAKQLDEKDGLLKAAQASIYRLQVGTQFGQSAYIKDKLTLPPDIAEKVFGDAFQVDGDKVVAKDASGNVIYSRLNPGEPADFEEAMETLVGMYPHKDSILRTGAPGSGAGGGASYASGKKWQDMSAAEKAAFTESHDDKQVSAKIFADLKQ